MLRRIHFLSGKLENQMFKLTRQHVQYAYHSFKCLRDRDSQQYQVS